MTTPLERADEFEAATLHPDGTPLAIPKGWVKMIQRPVLEAWEASARAGRLRRRKVYDERDALFVVADAARKLVGHNPTDSDGWGTCDGCTDDTLGYCDEWGVLWRDLREAVAASSDSQSLSTIESTGDTGA